MKIRKILLSIGLACAFPASAVHAQVPGVVTIPPVSAPGSVALSVTTSSATATLPLSPFTYNALTIENIGVSAAYLANGGIATTGGLFLASGSHKCLPALGQSTLSAITASGTTAIQITQSNVCVDVGSSGGLGASGTPVIVQSQPYAYTPLCPGQHNLAITSATALTPPTGIASAGSCVTQTVAARYATACAATANIKYTTDGSTTPTSSVGQTLQVGFCVTLSGALVIANFKAISATGTIDVEFFQ